MYNHLIDFVRISEVNQKESRSVQSVWHHSLEMGINLIVAVARDYRQLGQLTDHEIKPAAKVV